MHRTEEIFNLLSSESKKIKGDSYFKTGQEGLLKAFYFFRWCNKNQVDDTDTAVRQFVKGKIPEQQAEHFLTAFYMLDQFETDPAVKEAISEIDEGIRRESGGKSLLELLDPPKVQRRILKNIHKTMADGIDAIQKHLIKLKAASNRVMFSSLSLIAVNIILSLAGLYNLVASRIAQAGVPDPLPWVIIGVFLVILPFSAVLGVNFKSLLEYKAMGGAYPAMMKNMDECREAFTDILKEKKISIQ